MLSKTCFKHIQHTYVYWVEVHVVNTRPGILPLNHPHPKSAHTYPTRHQDPVGFSDVILGIDWIDHSPTQLFITEFLSQLKAARTAILQSRP